MRSPTSCASGRRPEPLRLTAKASAIVAIASLLALLTPASSLAIVGGTGVPSSAAPWVLQISAGAELCTGTLVAPGVVLTDAHCVTADGTQAADPAQTSVRFPAVTAFGSGGLFIPQQVSQIAVEPGYDPSTITNDLALIQLSETEYNGAYAPTVYSQPLITLATASTDSPLYNPRGQATVAGWGATSATGGVVAGVSQTLQEGGVALQQPQYCQDFATASGWNLTLDPSTQFCAQGPPDAPVSICMGDSGGPLFETVARTPVEIGVSDFGSTGCPPSTPSYFTSVLGQSSWLASEIPTLTWPNPSLSPPADTGPGSSAPSTQHRARPASAKAVVTRLCEHLAPPRRHPRTFCRRVGRVQTVRLARYTRTVTVSGTTTAAPTLKLKASGDRRAVSVRVRDGRWSVTLPARHGWFLSAAHTGLAFIAAAWDAP